MQTRDLDEAVDAVARVYCPHAVEVRGHARDFGAKLNVSYPTLQPLVTLAYRTPVTIDAGNFPRLFLMMHCARGSARTRQERREAEWRADQTLPFSAGFDTELDFDGAFEQRSVRLDAEALEQLCARWLGHPLEQRIRFDLAPFSERLERTWRQTLSYLWSIEAAGLPLPETAKRAFDEYLATLLLHQHPHNHSEDLRAEAPTPVPGLVRRAERFMVDNAETPITVSDVAAALGVSTRSLQTGFRRWRATTPNAYLRQVRLQQAREQLLQTDGETNVTSTALRFGFFNLGRFASAYQSTFGELPSTTLRRSRGE